MSGICVDTNRQLQRSCHRRVTAERHACRYGATLMREESLDLVHERLNGDEMNTNSFVARSLEASGNFMAQLISAQS